MIESKRMTQDEFMRMYNDTYREQFNPKLFDRDANEIIQEVEKVILSCERNRYFTLKVQSFRVITDYEEVYNALYEHEESRLRKKNKDGKRKVENKHDYVSLRESDIMLLEVIYYIKINTARKPQDKEDEINYERNIQVLIEIPRFVDKYYFHINGTYYIPYMQIVDRSVYNNAASKSSKNPSNTFKTMFQPIRMFRTFVNLKTYDGEAVQSILYTTNVFQKTMDGMKYLLAKFGLYGCMEFLDLPYIHFDTVPMEDTTQYYSFGNKKGNIFVITPRFIFDHEPMLQSLVCTIIRCINKFNKQTKLEDLYDPVYWMQALGGEFNAFNIEKGITVLDSIEDAYDLKSKENLRLPDEDKATIYCILRWMFREFNALRGRDIYDVSSKRVRIAECIGNMYATKLSRGLYRVTDLGKNVTMAKVMGAIYTSPEYLINAIAQDKVVAYKDMVNDNDAMTALQYTYKGISGLGDQGSSAKKKKQKSRKAAVPIGFKLVQPTQIGITDMDTSSPGDPGVSGMMCPMCNVNEDGSFVDYTEPNSWRDEFAELMDNYRSLIGMKEAISFRKKLNLDYDYIKEDMVEETLATYNKLVCPIIDRAGKIDYSKPPISTFGDLIQDGNDPDYGEFVQFNLLKGDQ